jgi:hypothetical protein
MSPYTRIGLAVFAAILSASGWQVHQRQSWAEDAARLREENSRLRWEAGQRLAARRAVFQPGGQGVARSTPAEAVLHSAGSSTAGSASAYRGNYRNEGQATPHAALQTLAWACDQGDEELMQRLLVFDDIARKKIEAHFAGLPPKARPAGLSLEALAAALYVADGIQRPYPVAEVLALARFEPVSPARMILRLPGSKNGDGYEFQQTAEGWKVAITEAVVDDYIRQSAKPASNP